MWSLMFIVSIMCVLIFLSQLGMLREQTLRLCEIPVTNSVFSLTLQSIDPLRILALKDYYFMVIFSSFVIFSFLLIF